MWYTGPSNGETGPNVGKMRLEDGFAIQVPLCTRRELGREISVEQYCRNSVGAEIVGKRLAWIREGRWLQAGETRLV